jgi:hypothetical protein
MGRLTQKAAVDQNCHPKMSWEGVEVSELGVAAGVGDCRVSTSRTKVQYQWVETTAAPFLLGGQLLFLQEV